MDLLAIGQAWLHETLPNVAASDVLYTFRDGGEVTVKATRAERVESVEASTGVTIRFDQPDWIISKSLLVVFGQSVTPQVGDTITTPEGNVFEVCHVGDGEPPAVDSDRYDNAWRIHTHKVEVFP